MGEEGASTVSMPEKRPGSDCSSSSKPDDDGDKPGAFAAYMRIFSYAERMDKILYGVSFVAAIASGTAMAMMQVVFGSFVGLIADFYSGVKTPAEFRDGVGTYALYFVYIFIARFVSAYIYIACSSLAGTRITRRIRYDFLRSILSQEIAYFDAGEQGSISTQATTNGNLIQTGLGDKLMLTIQAAATCIAAFIVAFVHQWKLTLITMTIFPAIVIVTGITVGMDAAIQERVLKIYSQAGLLAEDVISSVRNVHAFWMRPKLLGKYNEYLEAAHVEGNKKSPVYAVLFSVEYFLMYCGYALAFWQGARMFVSGEIPGPDVIVVVLLSVMVATSSLTAISPNFAAFANAASAAAGLFVTIDRVSLIDSLAYTGDQPESIIGDLEFSGVNFAYPTRPGVQVLKEFTLQFPAGKTTALVGASGSGKSTIVGLLERWYTLDSGTITLDGRPIDSLNIKWLRTRVRLVQQEPVLFNATIFENVCYGLTGTPFEHASEEAKMAEVVQACTLANAHDFISDLPQGYHTQIGERAGLLSGGQKQRIAIARAVISNPQILLLDESTSALDPHSEGVVQEALDKVSANRTTITIAHKLATIRGADNIVVLSKGTIVEQGTHESLIALGGAYSRLVKTQDLGKQAGDSSNSESESEDVVRPGLEKTVTAASAARSAPAEQAALDFETYRNENMITIVARVIVQNRDLWPTLGVMFVCCVVGGLTFPAIALVFASLMDVFNLEGAALQDRADFFALMFFIIAIVQLLIYVVLGWISNVVSQHMTHYYRNRMLEAILRQDVQFFDRPENTTGALASRVSTQPTQLQELMSMNIGVILITVINLISSSVLAIAIGWKLGLVVVCGGLPPMVYAGYLRLRLETGMEEKSSRSFGKSAAMAAEAVGAIRTVSSLALEGNVLGRYSEMVDGIVKSSVPSVLKTSFLYALTQSIEFLILALGFWYGCQLLSTGEYTMKQFYIVFIGVFFSGQAAAAFFAFVTSITKAVGAGNYIMWLTSLTPIVAETPENHDLGPDDGDNNLALEDVRFSYPTRPDTKVLRGISLTISPGQFVAFVGSSGCGKSTTIGLLERFYDPTSGRICLGPHALPTLNPRHYRSHLALVQQEPTLYPGSIRENIALGLELPTDQVTDSQILAACKQANIHEFIASLPEGLATQCGSRGLSLSGGQRQRIAIARALIRQPKVLVLDEATSALDTESEKVVQKALAEAAREGGRITVAVAHRLSTIRDADKICVFHGGKIVEAGTHVELMRRGGMYTEMCEAQSLDREA